MLWCNEKTTILDYSHSAFLDHSADVVQVVTKASYRQPKHLDLSLCPLGSEDEDKDAETRDQQFQN